MEKKRLEVGVAAVLTTLAVVDGPQPQGPMYMALVSGADYSWEDWELLRRIMLEAGMVTTTNETMSLTDRGRGMALKLEAALTSA